MSRFVNCDHCGRWSYDYPGTLRLRKFRHQRYAIAPRGEWQKVIRLAEDVRGHVVLDACCDGCAHELRKRRDVYRDEVAAEVRE